MLEALEDAAAVSCLTKFHIFFFFFWSNVYVDFFECEVVVVGERLDVLHVNS